MDEHVKDLIKLGEVYRPFISQVLIRLAKNEIMRMVVSAKTEYTE